MSSASNDARNAADQSAPTNSDVNNLAGESRRAWTEPQLLELPRLSELTLQSGIPGGGGTGGGGSGVIP